MTTLTELGDLILTGANPDIELHAIDPVIYVPFLRRGDALEPLKDPSGKTVQFRSRHAALKALRETGLAQAHFVHRSAYGEMIGVEGASDATELRQTVSLR